jgi:hypothetical protein
MKKKSNLKSQCCNAEARVDMSPDFEGDNPKTMQMGTCCYMCTKCHQPCDVYLKERKTWTRNPKTQIIPDKREKKRKMFTEKELKQIHKEEDF